MPTPTLHNEEALLVDLSQGDEKAFRLIFDHYRRKIYAYAYHLTESETFADEVVQDVFLKLWLNRETLGNIGKFNAWLHTVARNRVFDSMRKMARENLARQGLGHTTTDFSDDVNELLDNKENQQIFREAFNQLSPQQKLIFQMSREEGLKHEEIAARLNISRNTVKTHMGHALRTIREYLDQHHHSLWVLFILHLAKNS